MKMNILIIGLSLMASSVYARPDCPEAGFSEEQKAHVKELRQDFKSSVEGLSREERRTAWSEFHQTVLDTIPETDEQKVALSECFEERKNKKRWKKRRHSCSKAAGLSEEQTDQWKALREEFKSSVEGLSREERRTAWSEFHQTVLDTIPETDEQKAALSECFEDRKKRNKKHE